MGPLHQVTLAESGQCFAVGQGEPILGAARRAGIWLPYECGWGGCGTCKATVVEGSTELMYPGAPAVDARDARRRRILLCQSTPTQDVVLKPLRVSDQPAEERPTRDHLARLEQVEVLGPHTARFGFVLDREALYRPGQHAILQLGPAVRRCYSMAGAPGTRRVEFIVKRSPSGAGSGTLFELTAGAEIALELPYGDMWLRPGERPVVLVAGGTGISAILAVVRQLSAAAATPAGRARSVHVLYGAATEQDLVCWRELSQLVDDLPHGSLSGVVVHPGAGWDGPQGFVTDLLGPRLGQLTAPDVYLAGPPPMVEAVTSQLREHGIQADHVHYDSFG